MQHQEGWLQCCQALHSPRGQGKGSMQLGRWARVLSAAEQDGSRWQLSRRWLLAHGATEEGERALRELVQGPEYDQMMADLREQAEEQRKHARVELRKALATPELRRQLHIGLSRRSVTLWEWGIWLTYGLPLTTPYRSLGVRTCADESTPGAASTKPANWVQSSAHSAFHDIRAPGKVWTGDKRQPH